MRWPLFVLTALYVGLFIALPVGSIFLRGFVSFLSPLMPFWEVFTLQNFAELIEFDIYRRSITNTLMLAVVGGALATLFTAIVSLVIYRSDFPLRSPLEYVAMFPRAIPGMIAGIGFLYVILLIPNSGWLRNTIWVLVAVYIARFLPTAIGAVSPSLHQIGPDLDRSARIMGADWWTACRAILLPLIKPALFSAFALLFIQFTKEYSTAIFLIAPGSEVIGVSLLQAWAQGNVGVVAALATVQIALLLVFLVIARRLLGVRIYG